MAAPDDPAAIRAALEELHAALAGRRASRRRALARMARPSLAAHPRRGDGGRAARYSRLIDDALERFSRSTRRHSAGSSFSSASLSCSSRSRGSIPTRSRTRTVGPRERPARLLDREVGGGNSVIPDQALRDRGARSHPSRTGRSPSRSARGSRAGPSSRSRHVRGDVHAVLPPAAADRIRTRRGSSASRCDRERLSRRAGRLGGRATASRSCGDRRDDPGARRARRAERRVRRRRAVAALGALAFRAWGDVLRLAGLGYLLGARGVRRPLDAAPRRWASRSAAVASCSSLVVARSGRRRGRPGPRRRLRRGPARGSARARSAARLAPRERRARQVSSSRPSSARRASRACRSTTPGPSGCRRARRSSSSTGWTQQVFTTAPNPTYPPLQPVLDAAAFHAMGGADVVTLHVQFWFLVVGAVAAVAGLLHRHAPAWLLWPPLLLVLVVPRFGERLLAPAGRRPRRRARRRRAPCSSPSGSATGAAGASGLRRCCSPAGAEHEARGHPLRGVGARGRVRRLATRRSVAAARSGIRVRRRRRCFPGGIWSAPHDIGAGAPSSPSATAGSERALDALVRRSSTRMRAGRCSPLSPRSLSPRRSSGAIDASPAYLALLGSSSSQAASGRRRLPGARDQRQRVAETRSFATRAR